MHKEDAAQVTFWGVRGSYPQCKPGYTKVGGNTSCVSVEINDQFMLLDAGTGIIEAGDKVLKKGIKRATLLISHPHADHISGFAFFKPLHQSDFELTIVASGFLAQDSGKSGIEAILSRVISPPYFPIPWDKIACQKRCIDVPIGAQFFLGHVKISTIALDHPGGSTGYRLDMGNKSICYITDTAHTSGELNPNLVSFIERTNLLIYDAAFTEEEFAAKATWGHSTWNHGVALAKAAAIGELALFHHYPEHDDTFMAQLEQEARTHFSRTFVACQGMQKIIT